ncbi:Uncharacterised protein [Achromobacter insolitus]|uniref:hypothetical protein n=1 Tax=Achromobacter insolitus TaxID=217204 RepID=UPI000972BC6E|nr:hypothetical protein [Achromobacter insolitus]APX78271.1 hypothetical protein BUW96_27905 [Achromobacter insolitus]OWT62755.1 hypothetical protein CEY08_07840 [Achromobacter insolitus]CAB3656402.1 hypothetical protein LMG6003_00328 [Achromobacter insolitus]VEG65888.1 Uncharacterised protein [Achromobacter insolitus]
MQTRDPVPTPTDAREPLWERLRRIDDARPDFPGEHVIVFGTGAWLMFTGMRSGPGWKGVILTALGTALVGRAASGTGGIAKAARILKRLS